MRQDEIIRHAWALLEPELASHGYELIEVELARQGGGSVLRLFLDKEGGITLDDCAAATQILNPVLDTENVVDGHYMLEVSSPGIDRPVRKAEHFQQFIGERIKLLSESPVMGRSRFRGTLTGFEDGLITVECDGEPYEIHIENLKKANLDR